MLVTANRRRLVYLLLTCVLLAGIVAALQVAIAYMDEHAPFRRVGPPDPSATYEQTLAWLQKAILGTGVNYTQQLPDQTSMQISETYEALNYDGCNVTVKVIDSRFDTHQISFNLLDLSETGRPIKMPYGETTYWKVALETKDLQKTIEERYGPASYMSFAVSTPEMAQRVANAFNHAIRLCRRQKR